MASVRQIETLTYEEMTGAMDAIEAQLLADELVSAREIADEYLILVRENHYGWELRYHGHSRQVNV